MNSIKTYLIIGISIISLSLSGMRLNNPSKPSVLEQDTHDYTITVRGLPGFFEITQENREEYKTYFKTFGIELPEITTKVIQVKLKDQRNCNQQKIAANSDKVLSELPALMPLNLFTYDDAIAYIKGSACVGNEAKRITVQYRAAGIKQLGAFKPHTTHAKTVTGILEILKKNSAIANKAETTFLPSVHSTFLDKLVKEDDDSRTALLKDLLLSQKNALLHCFVTKVDLFDRLGRRHARLDTQAASIANRTMNNTINSIKNDPQLFMMSLEQALAIYDLLNEEFLSNKEGLITNLLVSHTIKPIFDQCIQFEKDRKIGLMHQENQEKRITQQKLEEKKREEEAVYNSTRAKIGRFIHAYKNRLIIAGCGITLLFSLALLYAQGYLSFNQ